MENIKTGYSMKAENYYKPTPRWIKFIADLLLLISVILSFPEMPEFPGRNWVVFGGVAAKLLSKFISEQFSSK